MNDKVKNIVLNITGSVLLAFGVCAFIMPYNLIVGGATGISLVAHRLTGVSVSAITLLINIAVLPLGYFCVGKKLVAGSVLSSLVYPLALGIFERIPAISGIADSIIIATLFGAVICGAGIGLVMKSGGSTGGVDIPVICLHKFLNIPVGKVMNFTDSCIMLAQIPIFGISNILYGLIYTYIMTRSLNNFLTMGEDRLKLTIVSESYEEIRTLLIENDYGLTMTCAQSGYTRTPVMKIECIMRSSQYKKAQELSEKIDPKAFITVEKVKDVRGQGFTIHREPIEL